MSSCVPAGVSVRALPAGGQWPDAQRPSCAHAQQHPVQVLGWVGHRHPGSGDPDTVRAQRGPAAVEEALPVPLLRAAGRCGPAAIHSFSPTLPATLPSFLGIFLKPTLGCSLV